MVALRERAARQRTQEDVEGIVRQFVEGDVSRLVPEVGMNVVGATPYAEEPGETAAVEGELPEPCRGSILIEGAIRRIEPRRSLLLSAREFDPSVRFAVNCRFDDEIEDALGIPTDRPLNSTGPPSPNRM